MKRYSCSQVDTIPTNTSPPLHMDFSSFSVLLTFIILLFMAKKKQAKRSQSQNANPKLPPGPWKLPLIGNLHQLSSPLPHHSLRDLAKKHGPIMHLQLGEISTVIVSSPKVAKDVLHTHGLVFAQRPEILVPKIISYNCTNVVFAPYGDYWRELRKICTMELLSDKRVASFRSIRKEEASDLIQTISSSVGSPVNLSKMIFSMTNNIISRAAFGKKCKDQPGFSLLIKEALELAGGFGMADLFPSIRFLHVISDMKPKIESLHWKLDIILDNIIKEHKENRITSEANMGELDEDLVDVLLRLQESGNLNFPITTDNIKAVILDVFTAGSETSSIGVEWAMSELMKTPRLMEKAQAEVRHALNGKTKVEEEDIHGLQYLQSVIKETLRLHPPAPLLLPRESREKCEIDGYEIPAKTRVMVNAWAIGRDPEYWSHPEIFKPERFEGSSIDYKGSNLEYIPFGAGRRICPGITFAVSNIVVQLAQLLYYFDWKLPDGMKPEDLDMTEEFGLTVRRKNHLTLVPVRHYLQSLSRK